jgi:transcriptional regulator of acetoin/glycerol metabolism
MMSASISSSVRMTEVARRLGIGRSTLYRKLSDIGIDTAA